MGNRRLLTDNGWVQGVTPSHYVQEELSAYIAGGIILISRIDYTDITKTVLIEEPTQDILDKVIGHFCGSELTPQEIRSIEGYDSIHL